MGWKNICLESSWWYLSMALCFNGCFEFEGMELRFYCVGSGDSVFVEIGLVGRWVVGKYEVY